MKRRGRPPHPDRLTPAEWRIVDGVRHGMSNEALSERRGTSLGATRFHLKNVYQKLGVAGRQALRFWRGAPAASALGRIAEEGDMQLSAIGQIALPVDDVAEAERFYGEVLGLPHLYTFGNLAFFDAGGVRLFLEQRRPNAQGGASVVYFRVDDIEAAHAALQERDVEFQGAPHMIFRHADGLEEWMAFFTDPSGNLLAIMAQVPSGG